MSSTNPEVNKNPDVSHQSEKLKNPNDQLNHWILNIIPKTIVYAKSLLKDPSLAEDMVQESLFRLLRNKDRYNLIEDGDKLIYRTITNLCINHTQRNRNLAQLSGKDGDDNYIEIEDQKQISSLDQILFKELHHWIKEQLRILPEMQHAALNLRILGHSKSEIAKILEISETNAGVLIYRARKSLMNKFRIDYPEKYDEFINSKCNPGA